ncbi:Uncharacterised protein [Bartonella grahamii]|uniref:Uncharacterized protein n=1 Tax=Bartonella grahamii TaxID=33045 RepID=A0A336NAB3_BARGR|nr:Uncharacterised protein [Bartonella grahamii]
MVSKRVFQSDYYIIYYMPIDKDIFNSGCGNIFNALMMNL